MRSFLIAFAGLLLFATGAAQAKVSITVDKNAQLMTVAVDGVERYQWPVSTGLPSYETPNGSFKTFRMEADHYSREFDDAPMPHSIFFTKIGHAIHGTDSVSRLGSPASHGCVRLRPDNASILFSMVRRYGARHTKLVVLDGPLPRVPHAPGKPGAPPTKGAEERVAGNDAPEASEHLSAKAHSPAPRMADVGVESKVESKPEPVAKPAPRTRLASIERYSVSIGSEAQVLREREAWLRSIDRKYGITR